MKIQRGDWNRDNSQHDGHIAAVLFVSGEVYQEGRFADILHV